MSEAQRTLESCERRSKSAENDKAACTEELSSTSNKLDDVQASEKACRTSKDSLCSEAASFARQLLDGRVANVGSCVPSKEQSQLAALLRGWENSTNALSQIAAFGAGESDTLPTLFGTTTPERAVERLLGKGRREPAFYRRLLTEAVRLAAPQSWQGIRSSGPAGIDAWFASTAPLDPKLVEEVDRAHATPNGQGAPPVSAALRLVQSYLFIAHCADEAPTPACTRAKQLQQLFESTGPLLVRRRIEEIWATECHDAGPDRVLTWVADFPTPHITARTTDYSEVAAAAQTKLFTCYLEDAGAEASFRTWLEAKLPSPKRLTARTLTRIDDIRSRARDGTPADTCGRAVRAMQDYAMPSACTAPPREVLDPVERWSKIASNTGEAGEDVSLQVCSMYARLLWEGRAATLPGSFERPPSADEMVIVDVRVPETAFARLRRACQDRHGEGDSVEDSLHQLSQIALGFGEPPAGSPWRVDPGTNVPIEKVRFSQSKRLGAWFKHFFSRQTPCQALGLPDARCQQCQELPRESFYDCRLEAELDEAWTHRARTSVGWLVAIALGAGLILWGIRFTRARRAFATWALAATDRLGALGLPSRPDPMRYVFPSHHDVLVVDLPHEPAWEPWGTLACVVRVDEPAKIQGDHVNHAVAVSHRVGARVVFLLHEDAASLDLAAVRAILDWAAKGGRAMHVLPLAVSRLQWAHSASDLLELVEETSLRGNPFDMRGRITSSSQFWNRERLVSGLLAETRAGRWSLVTGLRRFGKSSLALEVARRLTGPSAYVDLAGFHHEFGFKDDPAYAVNAVLRSLCARLVDSARALYPAANIPEPPADEIDAAALTRWIRDLSAECSPYSDGRSPPILLILDEIEQILAVGPDRLGHVLDALAILLGRLRNAVGDAPRTGGGSTVGILLCSALHPLLWAPLRTLGKQSIIGAYPAVCVPHLSPDAAAQMMRGLGARQGIRFNDEALDFIVKQAQGVPLLLRRIGTSVLELYDSDHARQGGLGAVQIGIEGAREAVTREEREGAPLRVWVESEIAESLGPAGALLRKLAGGGPIGVTQLQGIAERHIIAQFASSGLTSHLPEEELRRRAQEAASVMVRLLGETGLVDPIGDLTAPEAYELPDGCIRRVLRLASQSPRPESVAPPAP
ncbi:ATP-binding protein [Pendulispora brunnea]|uniref:ATP-binding protein n=1 Tax=Pendulispora brunnea TaxID=2905690 RepID=A0ABZ2K0Z1_9BACT